MKTKKIEKYFEEKGIRQEVIRKQFQGFEEFDTGIADRGVMFVELRNSCITVAVFLTYETKTIEAMGRKAEIVSGSVKDGKLCVYRKEIDGNIFIQNKTQYTSPINIVFLHLS